MVGFRTVLLFAVAAAGVAGVAMADGDGSGWIATARSLLAPAPVRMGQQLAAPGNTASVKIGKPRPPLALPKAEGPDDPRLPLVVIDAGHGGHDPGARGADGRREKDLTLALARGVRRALLDSGRVRVALTRDEDRFLVLQERSGIARRMKADLFVSIHADAAANTEARGASVYTLSEAGSDKEAEALAARENRANLLNGVDLGQQSSAVTSILIDLSQRAAQTESAKFAETFVRAGARSLTFRPEPHKQAAFIVLKSPDTPSALIETGFISNTEDRQRLASKEGQLGIAHAIRDGILLYFARRMADAPPASAPASGVRPPG